MQQFSSLLSWRLLIAQHVSGVFPPIIRSSMSAVAASDFSFVSWWQPICVRGRAGHDCHHDMKVKPEAATAVIELLIMGGKMPETYWAVNKRQDNKLENCCIWLVIYLNCTMMHGFTNLKFQYISNKMQRYAVYFIWKLLYIFRVVPTPIIRSAYNCIYSIWYLSHRYWYLPLSWKRWNRF
jgi:hypothetical protein